jgi:hypothetical protein
MFYVNQRWLGGLLTNFTTIQRSLGRLRELEAMANDGRYDTLSKKEIARIEKEKRKLQKNLDGIRTMGRLPDAVFIVDTHKEKIAVDEARKLKIPVIGIVDTNCDPDEVDFVIPGNDDALRAIRLFASRIADAVLAGRGVRERRRPRPGGRRPAGGRRPPAPAGPPAAPRAGTVGTASPAHRRPVTLSRRPVITGRRFFCTPRPRRAPIGEDIMDITAEQVKALRDKTGAGMMECKSALQEANGDVEEAVTVLRKRGLAQAAKRSGRATRQGMVGSYIHMGGKVGVLVEVNCESDFVARTEAFQALVKELAMQIAAAEPKLRAPASRCRPALLEKEKEIYRAQFADSNKPANVIDKIVEGKLGLVLRAGGAARPAVDPEGRSRRWWAGAKTGENITVGRFARFKVGETAAAD